MKPKYLLCCVLFALLFCSCKEDKVVPDWSGAPWGPFHLAQPEGNLNPVLTARDITDRKAKFIADPFLFHQGDSWYLFFEVYTDEIIQGDIALATSSDGLHWKYDKIILDEPFHLSYPYVFQYGSEYYMIPETSQPKDIRLYKAEKFPYDWKYVSTLASGRNFVDPSILFYNHRWWLFVGDADNKTLYLFYSASLTGNWKEHPQSPIITFDETRARPAGRIFTYNNGTIIRTAQANLPDYVAVRAFQVDILDTSHYSEHELPESPILLPGPEPEAWYVNGMHQFDPWWVGDQWIVTFDGKDAENNFSIGIDIATNTGP